jgi:6-phosphogluconolactonase
MEWSAWPGQVAADRRVSVSEPLVVVHEDAAILARAVAARVIIGLVDAQARRGEASIVLTGGRIAAKVHQAIQDNPAQDAVDWSKVDFWWGDERFLPTGDPERNETQARQSLLDTLPIDPARVHPMGSSDGPDGPDAEAAAARYTDHLIAAGNGHLPHFDILMLGVGEDGHIASVFPAHDEGFHPGPVTAVYRSPKPPPIRLTLTLSAINTADEVWLVASGDGKADAIAEAINGTSPVPLPCADVHGVTGTKWLLDKDAASKLTNP